MCVLKYSVTDVGLLMNKNRGCYAHSPFNFESVTPTVQV